MLYESNLSVTGSDSDSLTCSLHALISTRAGSRLVVAVLAVPTVRVRCHERDQIMAVPASGNDDIG